MAEEKPLFISPENKDVDDKDRRGAVKQEFKLFIKASQIDKETRGSCPVCQQWFMVAYLIAQKQDGVNFSVYTVQESSPPKEFEGWSKKFPVVLPVSCVDKKGNEISGGLYDNFDDLEGFFESINRECPELKRHNIENSVAVGRIESLYAVLNQFLTGTTTSSAKLTKALHVLNEDLDNDNKFFIDDELCFVDCFLLPRLQHIKVAAKRYAAFEIPEDCKAVWRYLNMAYKQPAFVATMPSDQDIVNHYAKKVTAFPQVRNVTTEKYTYDTYIPESILNESNGDQGQENCNDEHAMDQMEENMDQMEQEQQVEDNGVEYD